MKTSSILLGGLAALFLVIIIIGGRSNPDSNPALIQARQHTADVLARLDSEHARKMREIEIDYVSQRFGEDAADLFYRCTIEPPPSNQVNQRRCRNLLARVQAARNTDAREKTDW